MEPFSTASSKEEARIQAAYGRRPKSSRYSMFNPGHLFMVRERERRVLGLLKDHRCETLGAKTILDIGCGTGFWIRDFIQWGAQPENIAGIDLLDERVSQAKNLCPSAVNFFCGSAAKLDFPAATFDLVLQSTVFTSILDPEMKQRIAAEMIRVLKPDGLILWYDYRVNNPMNPDVRGVKRREIDKLFPGCRIELKRITLAPPITRRLAPYSWFSCHLLGKISFLCTHYLGVIRRG